MRPLARWGVIPDEVSAIAYETNGGWHHERQFALVLQYEDEGVFLPKDGVEAIGDWPTIDN